MPKPYYITTPIYYVNSVPHVGHALTMLVCDAEARFQRFCGRDAYFLTGTDENGLKVMEAAEKAGETPIQFVDRISQGFVDCWKSLNIAYDDFIRTTEERHAKAVQRVFEILKERGYIYLDTYEGWYDVSAETFVREGDLVDGKSPDGNEVRWVSEQNYFFRLSAFSDRLLEHINANPDFLLPEVRKNEVVSFINSGLRDISITRKNPGWGIPVPGEPDKVVYVWFDALINYLAATGWPESDGTPLWPADVHWMAKEIFTRFHATLWPAMLMGIGAPLPKTVIAHGWFTFANSKMSKSLGNFIAPAELIQTFGEAGCMPESACDALRFCLAKATPYENDTNFTREEVYKIYNSDLANDLGNALNRTLSMAHKFVEGKIPDAKVEEDAHVEVRRAISEFESNMNLHRLDHATESLVALVRFLNKYIDTRAPWALAKNQDASLGSVIRSMIYVLQNAAGIATCLMPSASAEISRQLGLPAVKSWSELGQDSIVPAGTALGQPTPIFPRLDVQKLMTDQDSSALGAPAQEAKAPKPSKPKFEPPSEIGIEDFMKVSLKVGRVLEAEPLEGSEKLVKLQVLIGQEQRQILAGIRKSYAAADLVGRQVIVVANLKPAKLMGHESQGMILAADGPDGQAILLQPEAEAPEGTSVH